MCIGTIHKSMNRGLIFLTNRSIKNKKKTFWLLVLALGYKACLFYTVLSSSFLRRDNPGLQPQASGTSGYSVHFWVSARGSILSPCGEEALQRCRPEGTGCSYRHSCSKGRQNFNQNVHQMSVSVNEEQTVTRPAEALGTDSVKDRSCFCEPCVLPITTRLYKWASLSSLGNECYYSFYCFPFRLLL